MGPSFVADAELGLSALPPDVKASVSKRDYYETLGVERTRPTTNSRKPIASWPASTIPTSRPEMQQKKAGRRKVQRSQRSLRDISATRTNASATTCSAMPAPSRRRRIRGLRTSAGRRIRRRLQRHLRRFFRRPARRHSSRARQRPPIQPRTHLRRIRLRQRSQAQDSPLGILQ